MPQTRFALPPSVCWGSLLPPGPALMSQARASECADLLHWLGAGPRSGPPLYTLHVIDFRIRPDAGYGVQSIDRFSRRDLKNAKIAYSGY